jgi:hypothetical protein
MELRRRELHEEPYDMHSTEQSISWEGNSCSVSQQITSILVTQKFAAC